MVRARAPTGTTVTPHRRATAVALLLLLGVVGLSIANPSVAAAGPTLAISSPADGTVVGNGTPVVVDFVVSNFVLVQPGRVGEVVGPTEGHVDVFVDGGYTWMATQVEPIVLPLSSGSHTIRLQLVDDVGNALSPDVNTSVRVVTTQGPAGGVPTIRIVSPVPAQVTGHDVYVSVEISNFTFVDAHGQPNAPNEGHVELFLAGVLRQDLSRYDTGFMVDLPDGNNTITARLVNNDHTPLSPDVFATVTIFVKGSSVSVLYETLSGGVAVLLAAILVVLIFRRRKALARVMKERRETP